MKCTPNVRHCDIMFNKRGDFLFVNHFHGRALRMTIQLLKHFSNLSKPKNFISSTLILKKSCFLRLKIIWIFITAADLILYWIILHLKLLKPVFSVNSRGLKKGNRTKAVQLSSFFTVCIHFFTCFRFRCSIKFKKQNSEKPHKYYIKQKWSNT